MSAILSELWAQWGTRFVFLFSSAAAYFFTLPAVCPVGVASCLSQADVLSHLFVPAWLLPYLLGFIPFAFFRSLPQKDIDARRAAAETGPPTH